MLDQSKFVIFIFQMHSNGHTSTLSNLVSALNELGDKFGYSTKTYNLLGTILIMMGDPEKAAKIFESAINDLK